MAQEMAVVSLILAIDDAPDNVARMLIAQPDPNPRPTLTNLGKLLTACAVGVKRSKYILRIDGSTEGASQGVLEAANPTITITFANITADETIVLGGVTLTWKASAANENQVTIGANLAAATTNLVAAINVHTKLVGLVSASGNTSTGVVTLTWLGDTRMAQHFLLAETGDAVVISATSFDGDTTDVYEDGTEAIVDLGMG